MTMNPPARPLPRAPLRRTPTDELTRALMLHHEESARRCSRAALWLCLAMCVVACVPVLGFVTWLVGGLVESIVIILMVVLLVKGSPGRALLVLLYGLLAAAWVTVAPVVVTYAAKPEWLLPIFQLISTEGLAQ